MILTAVAPPFADEAKAPWQLAQLAAYKPGPSRGGGGGVIPAKADAMEVICAAVKLEKEPIGPGLLVMPRLILDVVAPPLADDAKSP